MVAIFTPWTPDARSMGPIQQLPVGEPTQGRPREGPRTVVVMPQFPDASLELEVTLSTGGLYVRRDMSLTAIPETPGTAKRVRIVPIRDAPGNVTVELEDVSMGTSFRYCR
jgi:hypothetical protein